MHEPNDEAKKSIGTRVRQALAAHGKNQKWLAEKSGVPASTLANVLNGIRSPGSEVVVKLAVALNVSTDYLLLGKGGDPAVPHGPWRRLRRRHDILERIRLLKEKLEKREHQWRTRAKAEILGQVERLGTDTPERKAVEHLIRFFGRFSLPRLRRGRRRWRLWGEGPTCDEKPGAVSRTAVQAASLTERLRHLSSEQLGVVLGFAKDIAENLSTSLVEQAIGKLRGMTDEQLVSEYRHLVNELCLKIQSQAQRRNSERSRRASGNEEDMS